MNTIISFIKRFFFDLSHAIVYSVRDYDDKLAQTKSKKDRIIIWIVIASFSLFGLYFILKFIGGMIMSVLQLNEVFIP